ncbi:MAG: GNAT family N-acetyltransferase [Myxococcota bacterium]
MSLAPRLETDRLILRPFELRDFDAWVGFCADPEVVPFVFGRPLSRPEAWQGFAAMAGLWSLRGFGMWALEERETGAFVGRAGFDYPETSGYADLETGWLLGRPYWGRGLALEAAVAVCNHAFGALDRREVVSIMRPENERSIRLAQRLGMTQRRTIDFDGLPACLFAVSRDVWSFGARQG